MLTFSHISGIDDLLWKCAAAADCGVRSARQLGFMRGPIPAISNNDSHVSERADFSLVHLEILRRFGDVPAQLRTLITIDTSFNFDFIHFYSLWLIELVNTTFRIVLQPFKINDSTGANP